MPTHGSRLRHQRVLIRSESPFASAHDGVGRCTEDQLVSPPCACWRGSEHPGWYAGQRRFLYTERLSDDVDSGRLSCLGLWK